MLALQRPKARQNVPTSRLPEHSEGFDAYCQGSGRTANPYWPGSLAYDLWLLGYQEARETVTHT